MEGRTRERVLRIMTYDSHSKCISILVYYPFRVSIRDKQDLFIHPLIPALALARSPSVGRFIIVRYVKPP